MDRDGLCTWTTASGDPSGDDVFHETGGGADDPGEERYANQAVYV
jgi:hypothetical protein